MAHMSYSQYCGKKGHVKGGHRTLFGDSIVGPTQVLMQDPCVFGLPDGIDHSSYIQRISYGPLLWGPNAESLWTYENAIINHLKNRGP